MTTPPITSAPLQSEEIFGSRSVVERWLAAAVDRSTAESALLTGAYDIGSFCVRSGSNGAAVLSVLARPDKVSHYRTKQGSDGRLTVTDASGEASRRSFANIHEVIQYFSIQRLSAKVPPLVGCIQPPGSPTYALLPRNEHLYASQLPGTTPAVSQEYGDVGTVRTKAGSGVTLQAEAFESFDA